MRYPNVTPAVFLARPNRFVAQVLLDGEERTVHVKNTGRCRELLVPGARVWLTRSPNPHRKTAYDLIAVEKGARLINMDAQAPNQVFREWAEAGGFLPGLTLLKAEQTHGDSRFDFYWEAGARKGFVEVKGVTLEEGGAVYFPDAPTQRGVKEIPYYVAGILMYINPTLQFLVGLLYFHEALDVNQFIAFCIIWVGLAVTMADRIRRLRQEKRDFQASLRKE